jgi:RNA polymerase sigma-70 factor (ECF subfamily)
MHELSDEQLVAAYLERGDQGAFRTLVERHQDRIYGYLMGMVRDPNVANDLFQDTFLKAIDAMQDRRGSYTRQGRWVAWIMRIARNTTLDYLRTRKKWQDVEGTDDEDDRSFWDRLESDATPADEHLHREEQIEWLERSIEQLPPEQREVVLLRQDTDLTFREIAELTEVSINTALGRMRYALKNLRRMMQDSKKKQLAEC